MIYEPFRDSTVSESLNGVTGLHNCLVPADHATGPSQRSAHLVHDLLSLDTFGRLVITPSVGNVNFGLVRANGWWTNHNTGRRRPGLRRKDGLPELHTA